MRALRWNGINDLRVETVPHPAIIDPHDAIVKVTMSTTLITHRFSLEYGLRGYDLFKHKEDGCVRVVFTPP